MHKEVIIMLSAVFIIGKLGPMTKTNIRMVQVKRAYREDEKDVIYDDLKVTHWSCNTSNPFYRVRESHLVTIKGRLQMIDDEILVVAEQINYIEASDYNSIK